MRYKLHRDRVRFAIDGLLRFIDIPNDEADCLVSRNKTVYTYSNGIPFGDLRVDEYYAYQTLLTGSEAFCMERAFGIVGFRSRGSKLMKRLNFAEYRQIQAAVRLRSDVGGVIADKVSKRMVRALRAHGYIVRIKNTETGIKSCYVGKRKLDKILAKRGLEYLTTKV